MKDLRNLPAYLADTPTFRTWVQGLDAQLLACGLVLTTDTGQLDPATVTLPAASQYAGFRMYRFSDVLQATRPVFLRLEFGLSTNVDRPALRLGIGTATNGAGVLTGQVIPAQSLTMTGSKSQGTLLPSYCCGDGSRIGLCTNLDVNGTTFKFFIFVERARNPDGSTSNAVVFYWIGSAGTNFFNGILPPVGTVPTANSTENRLPMPYLEKTYQMNTLVGTEVALMPLFAVYGRPYNLISPLGYFETDISELVPFTTTWLGGVHTYLPLGNGGPTAHSSASYNMAMLWE